MRASMTTSLLLCLAATSSACWVEDEPEPKVEERPTDCRDYDTEADPEYIEQVGRAPVDVVFVLDLSGSTFANGSHEALGEAMVTFVEAFRATLEAREDEGLLDVGAAASSRVGVIVFATEATWWVPLHSAGGEGSLLLAPDTADWGTPNAIPRDGDDAYNAACEERFLSYGLPWDGWDAHPGRPDLCALGYESNIQAAVDLAVDGLADGSGERRLAVLALASGDVNSMPATTFSNYVIEYWGFGFLDERTCRFLQANTYGLAGSHFRFYNDANELVPALEALAPALAEGP